MLIVPRVMQVGTEMLKPRLIETEADSAGIMVTGGWPL
jgi:hypothetical protein